MLPTLIEQYLTSLEIVQPRGVSVVSERSDAHKNPPLLVTSWLEIDQMSCTRIAHTSYMLSTTSYTLFNNLVKHKACYIYCKVLTFSSRLYLPILYGIFLLVNFELLEVV